MKVFGIDLPSDHFFDQMAGKAVTESQRSLIALLIKNDVDLNHPDLLQIVAEEMGKAKEDRQSASITISIIQGKGSPLRSLQHRMRESAHGQEKLF